MAVPVAAEVMGIPLEEVYEYGLKRIEKPETVSFELKLMAETSLKVALKTLTKVAAEGPRQRSETFYDEDTGKPIKSVTYSDADVEAAQILVRLAVEALKLSFPRPSSSLTAKGKSGGMIQFDLWDSPGPWDLKKPSN